MTVAQMKALAEKAHLQIPLGEPGYGKQAKNWVAFKNACSPERILALIRVAEASQQLYDSAHNGNLYVNEYDALGEALAALDKEPK